jgi:CelD/BcsL family acetyltransferase involved in cellulose biosynthesis
MPAAVRRRIGASEFQSPAEPVSPRARDRAGGCEIGIVDTRAGFDRLEAEWMALFERAGRAEQVFQTFAWLSCWADHYLDGSSRLCVVTGRREGRLVMAWPLVARRRLGLTKLGWMGEPASQYGDVLIEPGPTTHAQLLAGWETLATVGADLILLRKLREDSPLSALLAGVAAACDKQAAPFAQFRGRADFSQVLAPLSAKARSSRRRLLRRLRETGDIAFVSGAASVDAERLVKHAFAMKRAWLFRRGLYSGPIENDAMLGFFVDLASREPNQATMLIDAIYSDREPIAVGITLVAKGSAFGHILAHDGGYDKQGVGLLLADHVMKSCFERGLERYDMLAPFDAYKRDWATDAVLVADYVLGITALGKSASGFWRSGARERLKGALRKMPPFAAGIVWRLARRVSSLLWRRKRSDLSVAALRISAKRDP